MNKIGFLVALVFIFGILTYLYIDDEMADVTGGIKKTDQPVTKIDSPVLNTNSGTDSKVITDSHKKSITPKQKINRPLPSEMEERIPQSTIDSVHIKIIEEHDLANEPDLTELESAPVDDGIPDSYPIEDADIYFVSPEHRYPGNIGGPPPLNLPAPN